MFTGSSCFPLSPDKTKRPGPSGFPLDGKKDQLDCIIEGIGAPHDRKATCFITDQKALDYIKTFNDSHQGSETEPAIVKRLPGANSQAIDLLLKMLQFNPFMRPTVEECLESPFF